MADLFQRIEDRKEEWDVEVMVTFLEIYNEEIRDLLAEPGSHVSRGGLSIREDKTVKVVGLVELKPASAEEVKEIVMQGNLRRTQSPTHANETSSRSHAVLQVHVMQAPRTAALVEERTMGTLSIIDLAGSERAAATTNMGQRMVEGANINKSLLALGNCINALCESGGAVRHVPYRNSKLTRLLKFSLGGNCKTVMIVCVAPTSNHFDDTHNTLVYAERATKIKTKVITRNVVNVDRHVGRYVEAINRLNQEISELKAKLAGKRDTENEIVRRRKAEASAEVERARQDMKVKVDQTKESIVDGATCAGKISVAKAKLSAIRSRLAQIDSLGSTLPADMEAERALLQSLAGPEEQAIKPDSPLTVRAQRSSNSNAMFDATMRAVSERKSERLDEVSIENVRLDAMCRRAEMEKQKAEEECGVVRSAVEDMAEIMVALVGMLGRCTVMTGEASAVLRQVSDSDADSGAAAETIKKVARTLGVVRENNDQTFKKLVGVSTEKYAAEAQAVSVSTLDAFSGYGTTFTRRTSSGPPILQQTNPRPSTSRRSSAFGANLSISAESRRPIRSPRKSLRSSISQPYRRVSDQEKKSKASKNVQWRDEVGQGELDDAGQKPVPVAVTIIPASPPNDNSSSTSSASAPAPPLRCTSLGGSESEWEDEKTEDSVSMNLSVQMSVPSYDTTTGSSIFSRSYGTHGTKRSRPSRLDPSFLRSRSKGSILGSLVEGDENASPARQHQHPLSDMNMNQMSTSDDSTGSEGNTLHVPKGRDRGAHGSPAKRPSTSKIGTPGSGVPKGRRRSNIGPLRNEKGVKRRSSMIPQLSPPIGETSKGAPRRVMLASPAKRAKRMSLNQSISIGALRMKAVAPPPPLVSTISMANFDPNSSADMSFSRSKPWR
jgi:kinesin family protein 18/19